jgi:hypothetical protein
MIQKLIGGTVVILIGTSLLPEVARASTFVPKNPNPKPEPHKQTYLEYVKERLEVEKLMK